MSGAPSEAPPEVAKASDAPAPTDAPSKPAKVASLEDWPASDDFLLREAVEAGAALGAIARGILPFTEPRTREDITQRWRALLYDPQIALPAARRMATYALDTKPRVAPLPTTIEFKDAFVKTNGNKKDQVVDSSADLDMNEGAAHEAAGGNATNRTDTSPKTPPSFADAEAAVFDMPLLPSKSQVDLQERKKSRKALQASLSKIRKLEASAQAATARNATSKGAVGVLQGQNKTYYLKKRETAVGRNTDDQKVDVDLCLEGNASKVSRQQCFIKLRWKGTFCLRNVGRRPVWINGFAVESGKRAKLESHAMIEVGGMRLLFLPNPAAVRAADPEPF
ncbi:FHA domain-containing protein [bacterium]|nr:FHA domain-containing protein [bacterium]